MKYTINLIIDAILFLLLAVITGIGILMKYVLIPVKERIHTYGKMVELKLFEMDRHQWGNIHMLLSFLFIALLTIHLVLHWHLLVNLYKRMIKNSFMRLACGVIFALLCTLFLFFPLCIKPEVIERGKGREKGEGQPHSGWNSKDINVIYQSDVITEVSTDNPPERSRKNIGYVVHGNMTIEYISRVYDVPSHYIKTQLKIPADISDNQKLGRLRTRYNFTMHDVENVLSQYNK